MSALLALAAMTIGVITDDHTALRAAPSTRAPRQAVLHQGDWVEIRGQRRDFLKVYAHRHERPGYVRLSRLRQHTLTASEAPALRTIVLFLEGQRGSEALGIAYAALYLKVAPKSALDAPIFGALGTMAARLALRASQPLKQARGIALARQLDVARHWGVRFASLSEGDRIQLCYTGDAFRRVLALGASPILHARAQLALSTTRCEAQSEDSRLSVVRLRQLATLVADTSKGELPSYLANRRSLRRSLIEAKLAYHLARSGEARAAATASTAARSALLGVDRRELAEGDQQAYDQAALYVAVNGWARGVAPRARPKAKATLRIELAKGERPGERCVLLLHKSASKPLLRRCTFGIPWQNSVRIGPRSRVAAIAVQHLAGWLELWVLRRVGSDWSLTPVVPALTDPQLGYVELAGFAPGGRELLIAREAFVNGRLERRFAALRREGLSPRLETRSLRRFDTFRRWQSPEWISRTLALR